MAPPLVEWEKVESSKQDCCVRYAAATGEDVEAIVRLRRTLAALAHVHAILMRLRDRAAGFADTSGVEQ